MQYLLDTNICVFFLRGKLNLDEIIRDKDPKNCFVSEITVFELRYGAENSENPTKSHKAVGLIYKRNYSNSNLQFDKKICKREGKTSQNR